MLGGVIKSNLLQPSAASASALQVDLITKTAFSASFLPLSPTLTRQYDPSFYEKPYNIRTQLFYIDSMGKMFPRYACVPEIQKEVINQYVAFHEIKKESMLVFWTEFVDCLLSCHNFEEESSPQYRAWAYGRLCRYVLLAYKEKTKLNVLGHQVV